MISHPDLEGQYKMEHIYGTAVIENKQFNIFMIDVKYFVKTSKCTYLTNLIAWVILDQL